jgi:hypothetical protein
MHTGLPTTAAVSVLVEAFEAGSRTFFNDRTWPADRARGSNADFRTGRSTQSISGFTGRRASLNRGFSLTRRAPGCAELAAMPACDGSTARHGSDGSQHGSVAAQRDRIGALHHVLEPDGGVAIIGDGSFWTGSDPWQATVREIIQSFLGATRRAGNTAFTAPSESYAVLLADTGYADIRFTQIPITRDWDVEHILGYLYSTSFSARHLYADRLAEFEDALRSELLESTHGVDHFVEHATFAVHTGMHDR